MSLSTHPETPLYAFDNNDPEASDRHSQLPAILDGPTFARLSTVGDLVGRRCLEVGAGGGSVARWLAERVGPSGRVLATDLNPRHMTSPEGYDVLRHDLVTDPMPEGPWDLIHARLVLLHIPQRHDVLVKLAAALAPGGALVIEDWATSLGSFVLAAPDRAAEDLVNKYQALLTGHVLPASGNDPTWATRAHAAMLAAGLVRVDTAITARSWPGGTAGALLIATNVQQVRDEFVSAGLSVEEIDRLRDLATDPRLVVRDALMFSTIGYRPADAS